MSAFGVALPQIKRHVAIKIFIGKRRLIVIGHYFIAKCLNVLHNCVSVADHLTRVFSREEFDRTHCDTLHLVTLCIPILLH
jgi:ribosomal protein S26